MKLVHLHLQRKPSEIRDRSVEVLRYRIVGIVKVLNCRLDHGLVHRLVRHRPCTTTTLRSPSAWIAGVQRVGLDRSLGLLSRLLSRLHLPECLRLLLLLELHRRETLLGSHLLLPHLHLNLLGPLIVGHRRSTRSPHSHPSHSLLLLRAIVHSGSLEGRL